MKTDTPETNAKREDVAMTTTALMVMTDFARQLERERDKAVAEIAEMRKIIKRASYTYEPMVAQALLDAHPENESSGGTAAPDARNH